jgi:hypothetical protein
LVFRVEVMKNLEEILRSQELPSRGIKVNACGILELP